MSPSTTTALGLISILLGGCPFAISLPTHSNSFLHSTSTHRQLHRRFVIPHQNQLLTRRKDDDSPLNNQSSTSNTAATTTSPNSNLSQAEAPQSIDRTNAQPTTSLQNVGLELLNSDLDLTKAETWIALQAETEALARAEASSLELNFDGDDDVDLLPFDEDCNPPATETSLGPNATTTTTSSSLNDNKPSSGVNKKKTSLVDQANLTTTGVIPAKPPSGFDKQVMDHNETTSTRASSLQAADTGNQTHSNPVDQDQNQTENQDTQANKVDLDRQPSGKLKEFLQNSQPQQNTSRVQKGSSQVVQNQNQQALVGNPNKPEKGDANSKEAADDEQAAKEASDQAAAKEAADQASSKKAADEAAAKKAADEEAAKKAAGEAEAVKKATQDAAAARKSAEAESKKATDAAVAQAKKDEEAKNKEEGQHADTSSQDPSTSTAQLTGDATFYGTGLGACGVTNKDTDYICAVSKLLFDSFPAPGGNPNLNKICGKKIKATYNGKSVVVTVQDRCEACKHDDLDFSPEAFNQIGHPDQGRLTGMTWNWL